MSEQRQTFHSAAVTEERPPPQTDGERGTAAEWDSNDSVTADWSEKSGWRRAEADAWITQNAAPCSITPQDDRRCSPEY